MGDHQHHSEGRKLRLSQREAIQCFSRQHHRVAPAVDKIAVQIGDMVTDEVVVPHIPSSSTGTCRGGDAIGSGYVYTGSRFRPCAENTSFIYRPGACGKPISRRCLPPYDGDPKTLAQMHEVKIRWNDQGARHVHADRRGDLPGSRREGFPICLDAALFQAPAAQTRDLLSTPPASCTHLQQNRWHDPASCSPSSSAVRSVRL